MIVGFSIWVLIGMVFGYFRARATYHDEIAAYPSLYNQNPVAIKRDAAIDATLTFLGWSLLGVLAGIAFVAWIVIRQMMQEQRKR